MQAAQAPAQGTIPPVTVGARCAPCTAAAMVLNLLCCPPHRAQALQQPARWQAQKPCDALVMQPQWRAQQEPPILPGQTFEQGATQALRAARAAPGLPSRTRYMRVQGRAWLRKLSSPMQRPWWSSHIITCSPRRSLTRGLVSRARAPARARPVCQRRACPLRNRCGARGSTQTYKPDRPSGRQARLVRREARRGAAAHDGQDVAPEEHLHNANPRIVELSPELQPRGAAA